MIARLETVARETGGDPVGCFPERSIGGSLPFSVLFPEKGGAIFEFSAALFDEGGDCFHKTNPMMALNGQSIHNACFFRVTVR
jgi:hypothetical protein